MDAFDIAVELCKEFEGFKHKPYICPAGVPTIGYGTTRYLDGTPVQMSDLAITYGKAERLLRNDLVSCYKGMVKYCPSMATETPNRQAAIMSWVYNLGAGRLKISTMRKRLNEKDWDLAAHELKRWVRGGGRILPGLVRRREAEANLLIS
jgi:lysozyme